MDCKNLFETPVTYRLHRLEYAVLLLLCIGLFIYQVEHIDWLKFIIAFAYIDLIGYIPGAIAFRLSPDRRISRLYYILYNTTHSFMSAYLVLAIWYLSSGPEWAMLAIPIHLFGDRAVFGNFLKPFDVSFEPSSHPLFRRFQEQYPAE